MFRFHIQGLCLCVLSDQSLTVLMLNSGPPREPREGVGFHLPGLFTYRRSVWSNSLPRLASITGRWAPRADEKTTYNGWDLAGLKIRVGEGGPPEADLAGLPGKRKPVADDWTSLHWILDLQRMLPTGRLKDEFRFLGPNTTAIVEFRGGKLAGGEPFNRGGRNYYWTVRPGYDQALTDTVDVIYDQAPSLSAWDCDGRPAGDVGLSAGEAWLVNEAPEMLPKLSGKNTGKKGEPEPPKDAFIYLDAFTAPQKEKDAVVFARGSRWGTKATTGLACEAGFYVDRSY